MNCHIAPTKQDERFLQQFVDVPLVVSSHGMYFAEHSWVDTTGKPIQWYLEANAACMEAIRRSDAVTGPSQWVAQAIRRNSLRPAVALYHGVDADEWTPGENAGYVLWNKTRVDPVCDPEPVGRLAALAPHQPFRTTFGGDGLPNVQQTGRLPFLQAKEEVRNAGVYLCTTRETFGIGTLEAMAAGVPVLGWRWGGQVEIIKHKETGWLAAPGNYDELLEGLEYCFVHREEMSQAAREDVLARWGWREAIARYVDVFEDVIAAKHRYTTKVSVVIRAYNLAEYLPDAIESVLKQTMQDFECIIVDDASPDKCGEIADHFARTYPSHVRVIHNETNQHLSGAHNVGNAAAQGKYIIALDADDTLTPNALELLSDALDHDRSIHIAYGNVAFTKPGSDEQTHSGWPPAFRAEWQTRRGTGERSPNLIPYAAMYRREVWELTGGYRRRYRNGEDADFWTRATSYGFRAKMITEADTLNYRIRQGSMSHAAPLKDWSPWYPWMTGGVAPAAIPYDEQVPVPSYEPAVVSVIIPVGPGHEELVIDALDSVDAQTLRLWECIVINDTGKPLPYVPAWAKVITPPMKEAGRVISDERGLSGGDWQHVPIGVAKARNLGIAASSARLFVPLDADDTLEPRALSRMFEVYQKFGGYVYSDWNALHAVGKMNVWRLVFYRCVSCPWIGFEGDIEAGNCPKCATPTPVLYSDQYAPELLPAKGIIHAVTALYPKEAWEKVGGFDPEMAFEDWDFALKLADVGVCGTRIPEPLFTYRMDTGQRREGAVTDLENSKAGILAKWGEYFAGRKQLMACSSCSGGGGGRVEPSPAQSFSAGEVGQQGTPGADYVYVEYTGPNEGTVTYVGPSKQAYNFGALPTERQKIVLRVDAEYFARRADFRIVETEQPVGVGS